MLTEKLQYLMHVKFSDFKYRTAKFKTEKYRCIYDNNIINTAANNHILTDKYIMHLVQQLRKEIKLLS